MEQTTVEQELAMRLVLSADRSVPVPARMTYRTSDPYAVRIVFHTDSETPVYWTFARELLVEGMSRPCGRGDVRIRPSRADGRGVVLVGLSSPDGDALLEAPSSQVSAWLEHTLRVVAPGAESEWLGIDDGLAALLSAEA